MIKFFNNTNYQARKLVIKELGLKLFLKLSNEDINHFLEIAEENILREDKKKWEQLCEI